MKAIVSGYGTWKSPLTAARVTAGSLRFDHLAVDGSELYWVEGRASEGGRYVVVRRTPDGRITRCDAAGRSTSGRACTNTAAPRLRCIAGRSTSPISAISGSTGRTASGTPQADDGRGLLLRRSGGHPERRGVCSACGKITARRRARSTPSCRIGSDGARRARGRLRRRLLFRSGREPGRQRDWHGCSGIIRDMPWDGTELWVAELKPDGSIGVAREVAGGTDESIFQPAWSPDGGCSSFPIARAGGISTSQVQEVQAGHGRMQRRCWPMEAEFGKPQWTFSQSTYASSTPIASRRPSPRRAAGSLGSAARAAKFEPLEIALEPTDGVRAVGARPVLHRRIADASAVRGPHSRSRSRAGRGRSSGDVGSGFRGRWISRGAAAHVRCPTAATCMRSTTRRTIPDFTGTRRRAAAAAGVEPRRARRRRAAMCSTRASSSGPAAASRCSTSTTAAAPASAAPIAIV